METEQSSPKKKLNRKFIVALTALVVLGGAFGIYKYLHALAHETTDDAQVEAKISPVIPKVSGYIKAVLIQDNQYVKKGDTLLLLDDAEYQLKLQQAEDARLGAQSQLAVAQAGISSSNTAILSSEAGASTAWANVATAQANIEAAKVQVWRAQNDYNRYEKLYNNQSITKQQFEQAQAAKETAEKQLNVLQEQKKAAEKQAYAVGKQVDMSKSQTDITKSQTDVAKANLKQAETNIENAKLYLSYTAIIAAEDGQVSKINLQSGQLVQAGQALFNLVKTHDIWVVANFKETQMEHLREGQKVEIKIDAFPSHQFEGSVHSISPATGAKFALLPPDNASGNFVKTVQRLPVKIVFSKADDQLLKFIRPGMNADVDVWIKDGKNKQ